MSEEKRKVVAYLLVTIDGKPYNSFHVNKRELFIGSGARDDYRIEHPSVLDNHLKISFLEDNGFYCEDYNVLSSGIELNGKPIQKSFLKENDVISIGPVTLRLIFKPKENFITREVSTSFRKLKREISKIIGIKSLGEENKATLRNESRERVVLQFQEGLYRGKLIEVTKFPFIIGSSKSDLTIVDPHISPKHAMIDILPDRLIQLNDLLSERGVYVNGEKISRKIVRDHDDLIIGTTKFCMYINSEPKPLKAYSSKDILTIDTAKQDLFAIEAQKKSEPERSMVYLHSIKDLLGEMFHSRYFRIIFISGIFITLLLFVIMFFKQSKGRSHLDVGAGLVPALRGQPTGLPQHVTPKKIIRDEKVEQPKPMSENNVIKNIPVERKEVKKTNKKDTQLIKLEDNPKSVEDLLADFSYHVDFQKTGRNIEKSSPSKNNIKDTAEKNKIDMVDVKIEFDKTPLKKQTQEDVKTVLAKKVDGIKACIASHYSEKTTRLNKIGIHFSLLPSGVVSDMYFDKARLIGKSLRSCMHGVLDKKVGAIAELSKPIGIQYVYTIKTSSKIDFSK